MQIEALPTAAGPNNLQNSACAEDATEGSVLVGNLAPDALYTTDVLLYEHLDPLADEQPIAFSATKDLDFAHGCNEIVDDTCVRDFEANVIVTTP